MESPADDLSHLKGAPSGTLIIRNSLLAGNTANSGPDVGGPVISLGHNLTGDGSGSSGYAPTDLVGTSASPIDPKLGPLQDNGGPTWTMALLPGSPAIGEGGPTDSEWDQRGPGYPRSVNGSTDIGAYEVQVYGAAADGTPPHEVLQAIALTQPAQESVPAWTATDCSGSSENLKVPRMAAVDRVFSGWTSEKAPSTPSRSRSATPGEPVLWRFDLVPPTVNALLAEKWYPRQHSSAQYP
jgi:hypothetical protein